MKPGYLILFLLILFGFSICYYTGYYKGVSFGVGRALDTVNAIVVKQIRSDTSVTTLLLECSGKDKLDTNVYFLSRKTCLKR